MNAADAERMDLALSLAKINSRKRRIQSDGTNRAEEQADWENL